MNSSIGNLLVPVTFFWAGQKSASGIQSVSLHLALGKCGRLGWKLHKVSLALVVHVPERDIAGWKCEVRNT
jgi:hypothetical protein